MDKKTSSHGWSEAALSMCKRRSGSHERLIREIRIGPGGLQIGEPLRAFRGLLTGFPEDIGEKLEGRVS